jgi:hypothetical protein
VANLLALITSSKAKLTPLDRSLLFTKLAPLLAKAPKEISQGLIKALQTDQFADSQTVGNLVAAELLKTDPEAAAEWVETLDPFIHARQFYQTIGHDWADKNKDAAMAWINTLQANMHNQAAAVEGLAESLGTNDLPALIRWAEQIDDSYVRGAALLKAAKLSLGFTDPLSRRQGIQSSLTAWTNQVQDQSEPQIFVSHIQNTDVKTEAQIAYFTALGAKDPQAARAYVKNLPTELQTQALQMVPSSSKPSEAP